MEALASTKHVRISARKARLVADLIRGKSVDEALGILALTPKKASPIIKKVMLSAAANARFKNEGEAALANERIIVKEIRIDDTYDPSPTPPEWVRRLRKAEEKGA